MYHYQHNVMGEWADCGKMAAMCGLLTPLAGNADETSSLYIYLWFHHDPQQLPTVVLFLQEDNELCHGARLSSLRFGSRATSAAPTEPADRPRNHKQSTRFLVQHRVRGYRPGASKYAPCIWPASTATAAAEPSAPKLICGPTATPVATEWTLERLFWSHVSHILAFRHEPTENQHQVKGFCLGRD